MSRHKSTTSVTLDVESDDPYLKPLIDAARGATDTEREPEARANLLAGLAIHEAYCLGLDRGRADGERIGHDAGAAPFLEGPWWKRAWTAARS